ncbi:CCA tRNA nucleotidyltransferase [Oryzicola mucosus]|uniref:CCA tRNA nucleotidyltransferase n=1 Tax=Oryzicola mucosus TaxID=2767425 RepID=A0A8J6TZE3_9HYPH|nr:CCA tRNA nucleotidyltransferase [Oryzicola mucosus]MBD0414521.1 CCA tRNA nucleotidyltransferase [Oryzicola mucosus]
MNPSLADAAWLIEGRLQSLLAVLNADGEEARVAGGAVRNALLGQSVADVDIATTSLPDETLRRVEAAGFKAVPTGIEHGTITVIVRGEPFEVTTLRSDVETDGRHAKVSFGRDWKADAERRDFTINALYAEANGTVIDLVGGLADIQSKTLRFIGDAEARIREDYLRILRFYRFFAWYGSGRPDAEGVKASARLKEGLDRLSAERVWSELKKLLSAPDPSRALLWMRQSGVLTRVLPESEKWGIDAIHGLAKTEAELGWAVDPLLRLVAIIPPDAARMDTLAQRLKMSAHERERLTAWALSDAVAAGVTELELARRLYCGSPQGIIDRLKLAFAAARWKAMQEDGALVQAGHLSRLLAFAQAWQKPTFPISGADLLDLGMEKGPAVGQTLKKLETEWISKDFRIGRDALLKQAAELFGNLSAD